MILVCGEVVLDVLRDPGQPAGERPARFVAHPGGSPANTAVALGRLGTEVGLCARIARGGVGALLREHLESNGVDLGYSTAADEPASLAFVEVAADGAARYSFYVEGTADWQWTVAELPAGLPPSVSALHTGSIATSLAPGRDAIATWLRDEGGGRMLSFDPNVRPGLLGSAEDARRFMEGLVASVHLVKASEEDLAWLYPGETVDAVAGRWRALGPSVVVVTLGHDGARGYLGGKPLVRPARAVEVVDTVGAGDSYAAALLHWLDREHLTAAVAAGRLSAGQLGGALEFAAAVASLACSRAGADPPRASEVDQLLRAEAGRR